MDEIHALFCHKCARKIWIKLILSVGILPCLPSIVSKTQQTPYTTCSHEDTGKIKLDLEANVHVRAVDCWTPPQREPTIGDLVETGPLRIRELFVAHGLFEAGCLLPEKTLPGREACALEERVLQDAFDTTERSDDVDSGFVELPQLAVMSLRRPPEGVANGKSVTRPQDIVSCVTHCLSNWYCFQSVLTRQPRSYASLKRC